MEALTWPILILFANFVNMHRKALKMAFLSTMQIHADTKGNSSTSVMVPVSPRYVV